MHQAQTFGKQLRAWVEANTRSAGSAVSLPGVAALAGAPSGPSRHGAAAAGL